MDWMYTLSGFLVGLIVGVTGVGGGSLMTPLLVLFFGVSPATAVGTDLLYASITKALGGWVHGRNGTEDWIRKIALRDDGTVYELHHRHLPAATIATGALVGSLVTVSSIGAGVLGTVALLFLYPRLSAVKVVGTDIAHAVPLTALAGMGHMALGTVDLVLLGSLLLGSLPGIYIGSHLSAKVPEKVLRPVLASMLLIIGIKMVMY